MKKSIVIICLMMALAFGLQGQNRTAKSTPQTEPRTLVITKLNTDYIKIGNKSYTIGDKFSDNEVIHWSTAKQEMWVKYTDGNDRDKRCLTQSAFAKRNAKSVRDYYRKINHPSSRATPPRKNQKKPQNKHKEKKN